MMNIMNEAEEYELFGYPDTEMQDCNFLVSTFAAYGHDIHKLLDIACGTGRHALEMAKWGYNVTGVDISPAMVRTASQKAADKRLSVTFIQKDMRAFDFRGDFDAAYILFNTMTLLTRNDDLVRFMSGVHMALKSSGLFIIQVGNLWPAIAQGKLSNSTFAGVEENGGVKRVKESEAIIGPYNNILCMQDMLQYWRGGEELAPKTQTVCTRIFSFNELDLLRRLTGFEILQVFGAMDINQKAPDPHKVAKVENPSASYVMVLEKTR